MKYLFPYICVDLTYFTTKRYIYIYINIYIYIYIYIYIERERERERKSIFVCHCISTCNEETYIGFLSIWQLGTKLWFLLGKQNCKILRFTLIITIISLVFRSHLIKSRNFINWWLISYSEFINDIILGTLFFPLSVRRNTFFQKSMYSLLFVILLCKENSVL